MRTQTLHKALVAILLVAGVAVVAAPVSRVTNFVDGQVLTASQLNSEFNNVIGGVNSVNNAQVATNAQISPAKIAATIKGAAIARDSTSGELSVKADGTSIEIAGDNLAVLDSGITTAKILDGAVTTPKLADGAVTQAKRAALGQQISSGSGTYTNLTSTPTDVTNLSVTITTTGRPVMVMMAPDGSSLPSGVQVDNINFRVTSGVLYFLQDSTEILIENLTMQIALAGYADADPIAKWPCSAFATVEVPAAGTYTYKVRAQSSGLGSDRISVSRCKLVAYEL